MTIKVALKHHTAYHFDRPVTIGPHIVRLRPAPHSRTPISAYSLKIQPKNHFINWQQDAFGNYLARIVFPEKARQLVVDVELIAEMTVINPFDFFLEESAEHFPFRYGEQEQIDLAPYLRIHENGPLLQRYLGSINLKRQQTANFLVEVNSKLQQHINYLIRMEPGVQSCEVTLEKKIGSCRDTAWLLVQILRHLGLAARFVSGYLVQLTADQKSLDGPSGPEQDFTDLHAWAEVYVPGAGWIGLDPTSGLFAGEGHIPLSCTPEPSSAAPISGATDKCEVEFKHSNQVLRIHEDPRVTKPFTEDQWQSILRLGDEVDQQLEQQDVRLTMGGEPTFVSIDDMEGAEWNIAALGKDKRRLAGELLLRLREKFTSGAVLHYGQGKWYPGEPLPRWALSAYWREDGEALWQDNKWLADEATDYQLTSADANQFIQALAKQLQLPESHIVSGYEDVFYYLWKEGRLPPNVDVLDNKLSNGLERDRVRQLFEKGLDKVTGYVLPIHRHETQPRWVSNQWHFRAQQMFLTPGDSPMGLRLPLDSLQWVEPKKRPLSPARDPFSKRGALPALGKLAKTQQQPVAEQLLEEESASKFTTTAICVEVRSGRLHIFFPPLTHFEDWAELIHAVEQVAATLKIPVILEGYTPPHDPRIKKLSVTPDPGVIEVNIHPAKSWREIVETTETLYEEARQTRLGTEKFMLDGRHSGTGGGNHVTLGAASPIDSPFLRRPELLRSLITYWQNHPSLSYLFSGLFIGPTSQAPRVDEARDGHLHELEIAFDQLPPGDSQQPWLVDRVLRNFLVDLTGNTHRSEFCIDKLYSPDSATGRLGLVEFRNFEMPPHARMSAVQLLLLRSLVADFWQRPLQRPLVRWGTQLHDRFMLPYFVWEDFKSVIEHLQLAGYAFDMDWFAPFFEFRFPHIGRMQAGSMTLDLRAAIEPWHVLGEESGAQGTARYVDSSLERIQIKVQGLVSERYRISCNGIALPLHSTGTHGEYVAGVRYKAWGAHSALHPTIGVHTPLTFDLVDVWNRKSLGGCTYHVSHPGGRNYDTFPVNANEAEARRIARFVKQGHSQGTIDVAAPIVQAEHPFTLDLRQFSNYGW